MAERRTEVSSYIQILDQYGDFHIVIEHTEYACRRGVMDWRPLSQRFTTDDGTKVELMEDGLFVSLDGPTLRLQRMGGFHGDIPDTGLRLDCVAQVNADQACVVGQTAETVLSHPFRRSSEPAARRSLSELV